MPLSPATSSIALWGGHLCPNFQRRKVRPGRPRKAHVGHPAPMSQDTLQSKQIRLDPKFQQAMQVHSVSPWNEGPPLTGGDPPSTETLIALTKASAPDSRERILSADHVSFGLRKFVSALSKQQRHQSCFQRQGKFCSVILKISRWRNLTLKSSLP